MTSPTMSRLEHLDAMTDGRGLFEHARGVVPRREHGYCVDDNARLLVVTSRAAGDPVGARLSGVALRLTLAALAPDGRSHNRMNITGRWTDRPSTDDCWGRNVWGLGVAAARHEDAATRRAARAGFDLAVGQRSSSRRAMAFAALGAAEVLTVDPAHRRARSLLAAYLAVFDPKVKGRWPEERLAYANAALAEATIAAGAALDRRDAVDRGLDMLDWLLTRETASGHLSVTAVGGSGLAPGGPHFDQQPIEAGALADACWLAATLTGDPRWERGVFAAWRWFEGDNDTGAVMHDAVTGGSYDGLQQTGVNSNQGAESTIALVGTRQRVATLLGVVV
jgi:hypothetical protein